MPDTYLKQITLSAGAFWVSAYLLLVFTPIFILLMGEKPIGEGFWWDLSMALGFAGLVMVGVQFFLTARFRGATAPFGIDIIYYFHRYLAVFAFGLLLSHPAILMADNRALIRYLDPFRAPWHISAGSLSLLLFGVIIISSLYRKQLSLEYDWWRIAHGTLATLAVILALTHIMYVGKYTGSPWKKVIWSLFILSWVFLLIYVRIIRPWFILKKPYRVFSVEKEADDTWVLTVRADGHEGMNFLPGQFVWLTLGCSPFLLKEHPFSISSSSLESEWLQFTIKEFGDFTRTIKDTTPDEVVYLDGPCGAFSPDRYSARSLVLIAGGVGIAPIMSMLRTFADRRESRPIYLFDCNRSLDHILYRDEIEVLKVRMDLKVIHVLENPSEDWMGEKGFISMPVLEKNLPGDLGAYHYFICGPEPMTKALERNLYTMGVPLNRFHTEIFNLV